MDSISGWVLSIVGIIILSILVELILPDGKISKFIRSIFGYLIIIVVLSPVFSFLSKKEYSLDNLFETSSVEVQEGFIAKVNRQYLDLLEQEIENKCEENGIKFVEVGIEADIFENDVEIKKVSVDLSKCVIGEEISHKDIKSEISKIILSQISAVDEEMIVFYE